MCIRTDSSVSSPGNKVTGSAQRKLDGIFLLIPTLILLLLWFWYTVSYIVATGEIHIYCTSGVDTGLVVRRTVCCTAEEQLPRPTATHLQYLISTDTFTSPTHIVHTLNFTQSLFNQNVSMEP